MKKTKIYHFYNGSGGGVLSVIKNLVAFSLNSNIENHIIHTINKKTILNYKIEIISGAFSQQLFYYSPNNNFYYTCKQLAKLLPNSNVIIVAHDWLELGMVSNLGLQNPVIHYLHGDYDYYYQLAIKNQATIDLFIAVSQNIQQTLQKKIADRAYDILYLRFPVPDAFAKNNEPKVEKNIIFIGRLTIEKGYFLLPEIARKLNTSSTKFKWHIVGINQSTKNTKSLWDKDIDVRLYGNIENDIVQKLLSEMDFFILPSIAEGMPVSLIEAMKAGAIPFVNNIKGGVQELIVNGETGFLIENNSIDEFADKIIEISRDENILLRMSYNVRKKSNQLFNQFENSKLIENAFLLTLNKKISKKSKKNYGSRLDHLFIPNFITKTIRYFIK
jgi:glycosyltransferase involved in cell wall biosynthesis